MFTSMKSFIGEQIAQISDAGLYKAEHIITSPQRMHITVAGCADVLLEKGVYVTGFSYPVVPKGAARIRTQISAAHTKQDLDFAVEKFAEAKQEVGI